MSANEDLTPQEAAQVMRRWADAVETVTSAAADHRAEQLENELSRERALGDAATGERNTVGEAMLRFRQERDDARTERDTARAERDKMGEERWNWRRKYVAADAERKDLRAVNERQHGELEANREALRRANQETRSARAEAERLQAALDGAAEECEELHGEVERLRAEIDDLRAATPRAARPSDVKTGQAVAWFSVEDMQWRVRRIKSGPDAACFSISQMLNPHQKVVVLGEPPRELDQEDAGATADAAAAEEGGDQ